MGPIQCIIARRENPVLHFVHYCIITVHAYLLCNPYKQFYSGVVTRHLYGACHVYVRSCLHFGKSAVVSPTCGMIASMKGSVNPGDRFCLSPAGNFIISSPVLPQYAYIRNSKKLNRTHFPYVRNKANLPQRTRTASLFNRT